MNFAEGAQSLFPDAPRGGPFLPDERATRLTATIVLVRAAGLGAEAESKAGAFLANGRGATVRLPAMGRGWQKGLISSRCSSTPTGAFTRAELARGDRPSPYERRRAVNLRSYPRKTEARLEYKRAQLSSFAEWGFAGRAAESIFRRDAGRSQSSTRLLWRPRSSADGGRVDGRAARGPRRVPMSARTPAAKGASRQTPRRAPPRRASLLRPNKPQQRHGSTPRSASRPACERAGAARDPDARAAAAERARAYAPHFRPSHSPPAYIQHAAFLI